MGGGVRCELEQRGEYQSWEGHGVVKTTGDRGQRVNGARYEKGWQSERGQRCDWSISVKLRETASRGETMNSAELWGEREQWAEYLEISCTVQRGQEEGRAEKEGAEVSQGPDQGQEETWESGGVIRTAEDQN
ncbi:hypothetical protein NDU88_004080 [Pleurodeles waltl]|uniref:Uncharacterized protein n=1 Tax=Pleurodeles waltl TaxID=8319 RepID=A0AAV7PBQ0_PLEWA|nr:hypothetical protein NDU88_004080 [Pleurodeles waltl]